MKAWSVAVLVLAAAAAGFVAGRVVGSTGASAALSEQRTALERVQRERDEAVAATQKAQAALAAERRARASDGALPRPEPVEGVPPPLRPADDGTPTPAPPAETDRARAVRELVTRGGEVFADGDGEAVLEVLRRLARLQPEGRTAAMELAVRVNADVYGAATLRLDEVTFQQTMGDTELRDLMLWSLDHESPTDFRVIAVSSIPWVVPKERTLDVLGTALAREKEVAVQQAIVVRLALMNDSRAEKLLVTVLTDATRDAGVRAQVAASMNPSSSEEFVKAVEAAAESQADSPVRSAARAALVARDPPLDGYLVQIVFPDGAAAAAGVRPGDILVTYAGRPARTPKEIRAAADEATTEVVPVVVLRDGAETTLQVRRGRLGVQGRAVRRRE